MIELHISSLLVGAVFGLLLGLATAFYACWIVDRKCDNKFSDGWYAGVKYGKECKEKEEQDDE